MTAPGALSRRRLLRAAGGAGVAIAGAGLAAACTSSTPRTAAPTELPRPETTTVRMGTQSTCDAPYWLIEELLREEGFTEVTFSGRLLLGQADFAVVYANYLVSGIDAGFPFRVLAGVHTGCIELWAAPGISSIRDLRGKTYQVFDRAQTFGGRSAAGIFYGFLLSTLAHIGIDPGELKLVDVPPGHNTGADYFAGKSDAIILVAHDGAVMRRHPARRGSMILDSAADRPWSQNYCCMLVANRDWANANPVAAKRVTRALLRASDRVAADRQAAVRVAMQKGIYGANPDVTPEILLETIGMLSYDWREFDPADTLRFFALRLRDAKLVKMAPQQILDEGSDFAYFYELRKELRP